MALDNDFWLGMTQLANTNPIRIDRHKRKPHSKYLRFSCPLDFGYLENTTAGDGEGMDVRIGSSRHKTLTGILCAFDKIKLEGEIKHF